MGSWQVQDAKARLSAFLEASLKEDPQVVTKRGFVAALLVPVDQWRRLQSTARPTLEEILLAAAPRAEIPVLRRSGLKRRAPAAAG